MITYSNATSLNELQGILLLQNQNLANVLTIKEIEDQGFVTCVHSLSQLQNLNAIEKHIIAKDNEKIVGYLLAMTQQSRSDIPILVPMFKVFENILFEGQTVSDCSYIVVGQVCIDKEYRGQ